MVELAQAVGMIAPLYNILLIIITFFLLWQLISLKHPSKKVFLKPWYFVFVAIGIFLLESAITALKFLGVISETIIPRWFNAVFELMIIIIIIYMLFMQFNYVKKR